MRPLMILVPALTLPTACAAPVPRADDGLRNRQEAACTAAILDHIGHRPRGEVSSRWVSAENGQALVEIRDGDRLHLCHVDAAARVLGYDHPGA